MTAIKPSTLAPKVKPDLNTDSSDAAKLTKPQAENKSISDAFTVSELVQTLNEMKQLQEKSRSGELKLTDQDMLAELDFHITELSDTLSTLEQTLKNK